jgi:hypothetical protein
MMLPSTVAQASTGQPVVHDLVQQTAALNICGDACDTACAADSARSMVQHLQQHAPHGTDSTVRGEEDSHTATNAGLAAATSASPPHESSSCTAISGGSVEPSSSGSAPCVPRVRSRRRPPADIEFALPPSHRTLTIADLPRGWNGQRKAWYADALRLREQLLRGVHLDARQRMRIQESLFGQGEGLLIEDNYDTDFELERRGVTSFGAERDSVLASCQAQFASRMGEYTVSEIVRDTCERHLAEVLFERQDRRRTRGRFDDDGGNSDDGVDESASPGAFGALSGAELDGDTFDAGDSDTFDAGDSDDDGCEADAY